MTIQTAKPHDDERRFFGGMALAMIVAVAIGFAPSFFLRGVVHVAAPLAPLTPLIWLHGLVFSAWMILFWVQTRLIAAGRPYLHIKLGVAGMAMAAVMAVMLYFVAVGQVERASNPPFVSPLSWSALTLVGIPVFAGYISLGWRYRRNAQAHKRLMLAAALLMMDPAIGRIPIFPLSMTGNYLGSAAAFAMFLPLIFWDLHHLRRLHWATLLGAGGHAAMYLFRNLIWTTDEWQRFAAFVLLQ